MVLRKRRAPAFGLAIATLLSAAVVWVLPRSNASFSAATDGSAAFSMRSVSEILSSVSWLLDANDTSQLYQDTNCSQRVTARGQTVRCWKNGANGTQRVRADNTTPPMLSNNPIAGKRSVRFRGGRLVGPDIFGGRLSDAHIFIVSRENYREWNYPLELNGRRDDNARFLVHIPWTDGYVFFDPGSLWSDRVSANPVPLGQTSLLNGWKDSSISKNGLKVNNSPLRLSRGFTIASTSGGILVNPNRMDIAEILVFPRRLSAGEETMIQNYLAEKWSATLR